MLKQNNYIIENIIANSFHTCRVQYILHSILDCVQTYHVTCSEPECHLTTGAESLAMKYHSLHLLVWNDILYRHSCFTKGCLFTLLPPGKFFCSLIAKSERRFSPQVIRLPSCFLTSRHSIQPNPYALYFVTTHTFCCVASICIIYFTFIPTYPPDILHCILLFFELLLFIEYCAAFAKLILNLIIHFSFLELAMFNKFWEGRGSGVEGSSQSTEVRSFPCPYVGPWARR